jgi:hypothetical protein
LRVATDKAGKRGKCPKCGTALTIPFESSVPDEAPPPQKVTARPPARPAGPMRAEAVDDEPEYEPPRRGREDYPEDDEGYARKPRSSWGLAQIGLLIVFIAFCIMAAGEALGVISTLLLTIARIGSPSTVNAAFTLGGMEASLFHVAHGASLGVRDWLIFVGMLGAVGGYVLCILVPNRGGTMPLAITTTALAGVYLILFLIAALALRPSVSLGRFGVEAGGSPRGYQVSMMIANLLFSAHIIIFSLYLQAVLVVRKKSRYANPMGPMILACVFAGIGLVLGIMCFLPPTTAVGWIVCFLCWAGDGVFIAFLTMYILTVWSVRSLLS